MPVIDLIYGLARLAVWIYVIGVIALVVLRGAITWVKLNPFGWFAFNIRRYSEPLIYPLRRSLVAANSRYDIAPVLLVVLVVILAAFGLQLLADVRSAIQGLIFGADAVAAGHAFQGIRFLIGHALLVLVSLLLISIILQVLFSWLGLYGNRLSRFIYRVTDPVLEPLRRTIPPMGMFDLSPLIAYFLLSMIRWAIQTTLLS